MLTHQTIDLANLCTCSGEVNAPIPSSGSVDKAFDQIHNSYEMNKNDQKSQFYKKKTRG